MHRIVHGCSFGTCPDPDRRQGFNESSGILLSRADVSRCESASALGRAVRPPFVRPGQIATQWLLRPSLRVICTTWPSKSSISTTSLATRIDTDDDTPVGEKTRDTGVDLVSVLPHSPILRSSDSKFIADLFSSRKIVNVQESSRFSTFIRHTTSRHCPFGAGTGPRWF